ncbi:MAG: acetylxylan esterase [Bryobacteraceae bacterium]|nr:acetylxylan esterase [Bryobacteraceae bacterium]
MLLSCLLASLPLLAQEPRFADVRAKSHVGMRPFGHLEEWEARRTQLRRQILAAAGLWPEPPRHPLAPRVFRRLTQPGFQVETVTIATLPGFRLAGNLYRPNQSGRFPAILLSHGHWKGGRAHHAHDYSVPALAASLAAQGFVVFAPDMVGYGDTRQLPHVFGKSRAEQQWAFHPLGLQLWNSIRSLDYLSSLSYVDPERLAATGTSGGASQTLLLAAVDDRVQASALAGMVSASFQGDDACEEAPGLRASTNNLEFAAMAAPRPQLLISATGDWTRRTAEEAVPAIRNIYRLYDSASLLTEVRFEAGHNCNRDCRLSVGAFFQRHLLPPGERNEPVDLPLTGLATRDLLAGLRPRDNRPALFAAWRAWAVRQSSLLNDDELRQLLRTLVGLPGDPDTDDVSAVSVGTETRLQLTDAGNQVHTIWSPGVSDEAVVWAGGAGKFTLASALRASGSQVLQVFAGSTKSPRGRPADYLTYHWSDDANRVQDLVTALVYAHQQWPSTLHLACEADTAAQCLLAAALVSFPVDLAGVARIPERDWQDRLFIPGLQHAGGMASVMRLLTEAVRLSNE